MTVVETVLVFAGIPAGVLLVVAALVLAPSAMSGQSRYRPGRPWGHAAAWWLPDPEAVGTLPSGVAAQRASQSRAIAAETAERADRKGLPAAEAKALGEAEAERRANVAVGVRAVSGEVVAHGAPAGDPSDHWLQYGPVPGAESAKYGFTPRQMARIDEAITYSSRETGLTFSLYLGPLEETEVDGRPDRGRTRAEEMFGKLAADGVESPVLVAVSPDQRVLQIVTGEYSSRRLPNRACALAALGMRAAFSGGDLTGGVVTGLRMLADAAGSPRT